MKKAVDVIGSLVADLDLSAHEQGDKDIECVSFWISREHHDKYEQIQRRTKRNFSKKLIKLIELAIDKVPLGTEAGRSV